MKKLLVMFVALFVASGAVAQGYPAQQSDDVLIQLEVLPYIRVVGQYDIIEDFVPEYDSSGNWLWQDGVGFTVTANCDWLATPSITSGLAGWGFDLASGYVNSGGIGYNHQVYYDVERVFNLSEGVMTAEATFTLTVTPQ